MKVANYGTVLLTIADKDKEEVLPLARRFYNLGFNIEATSGTADFLRRHGLRTRLRRKLCEGSSEIIDSLRQGHVSYTSTRSTWISTIRASTATKSAARRSRTT